MADTNLRLLTRREIATYRRLARTASPGPWRSTDGADTEDDDCGVVRIEIPTTTGVADRLYICDMESCTGVDLINAEFIALSRDLGPRLVEEVLYWRTLYQHLKLDIERRLAQAERLNALLVNALCDGCAAQCNGEHQQHQHQQQDLAHPHAHNGLLNDFALAQPVNGQDDE